MNTAAENVRAAMDSIIAKVEAKRCLLCDTHDESRGMLVRRTDGVVHIGCLSGLLDPERSR